MRTIQPQAGPQAAFLASPADVVLYGGGAGSGKSYALLLDPLRYVQNPGFGAVIFRRTLAEIKQESGLWETSYELYSHLGATPNEQKLLWRFPSGARIRFWHIQTEADLERWHGSQIAYLGFDELPTFTERMFFYMLSRNRSTSGVRPCVRATSNADADSWVARLVEWYIDDVETLESIHGSSGAPNPHYGFPRGKRSGRVRYFTRAGGALQWADEREELAASVQAELGRGLRLEDLVKSFTFIPATIYDNPILLEADPSYLANLLLQDDVTKARLLENNWRIRSKAGLYFPRDKARVITWEEVPVGLTLSRHWDLAGSRPTPEYPDPDYTMGALMSEHEGRCYWLDAAVLRDEPAGVERLVKETARSDGRDVPVYLEQEPGQSGKSQVDHYARRVVKGYAVRGVRPTGDKVTRAQPASAAWSRGEVMLVAGPWVELVLALLDRFPDPGVHDEPADLLSQFWQVRMVEPEGREVSVTVF